MFVVLGNATIDEAMAVDVWPTPGQTIAVGAPKRDLGGKGANQAIVLRRAGAPMIFFAAVGRDPDGDRVTAELAREGVDTAHLIRLDCATDRSLIFVGRDGENAIASTTDAALSIDAEAAEAIAERLEPGDGLLLQGNLALGTTRAAFEAARRRGATTIFNPSPLQEGFAELLRLVDLLVLNEGEAASLVGPRDPDAAVDALHALGARTVVLTLGSAGSLASDGHARVRVPAERVPVVDTTGAGDTFMGVLVAALCYMKLGLEPAVRAASEAAAITVQRAGTLAAFPSAAEIAAILRVE